MALTVEQRVFRYLDQIDDPFIRAATGAQLLGKTWTETVRRVHAERSADLTAREPTP